MARLSDKVAIVTGAGQGLGKAYALALAREGSNVTVADIDPNTANAVSGEIQKNGGTAQPVTLDVAREKSVNDAVQTVGDKFGAIDILINNAALQPRRKSFDQISVEEWDQMMDVNLKGCWLTAKAVVPFMRRRGKGKIINITSTLAIKGGAGEIHCSFQSWCDFFDEDAGSRTR